MVRAFPNLKPRRPTVVTHAGDGTNRLFVCTQQGVISVIPNNQQADNPAVFLDIESRVRYTEKEPEEGILGLAFHPQYKTNGLFYLFYTNTDEAHTSVLSQFRVSPDNPNQADAKSEVELLRAVRPYWNHSSGCLAFGPDGYLYLSLGDGGLRDDPHGNGQNLETLLGKILRIDVDHVAGGQKYAIPPDNPFVGQPKVRPEIYAYGFRNPWGLAFDRQTKLLLTGDVGQDLWEEIDLVAKGGNYGWKLREGKHKFMAEGSDARPDLIEPIWEYHHDLGKSITGGVVYRGARLPELAGHYLYADYVSGKVWALKYDVSEKRVVANRQIASATNPYIAIGEDERGEVFFTDVFGQFWLIDRTAK